MSDGSSEYVELRYSKTDSYRRILTDIQAAGVCPFCPENFFRWHSNPILNRVDRWFVTENFKPYENAAIHLLIISEEHKQEYSEVTVGDWLAVHSLIKWTNENLQIAGGAFAMRYGNPMYTGATVRHAHGHLISPKIVDGQAIPVYFPIG